MNKCIFCGRLSKEPTKGLHTKGKMDPMCILLIQLVERDFTGKWVNTLVEVFSFRNRAIWAEKKLRKGMKLIAICTMKTVRYELQPEVGKTKKRIFYKPFFILEQMFCTETPELDDYAQDRDDVVFAGVLGETLVDAAAYQQQRQKNDYDYSKSARQYKAKVEYPKGEGYYNDMLDNIADNADMGDVEK